VTRPGPFRHRVPVRYLEVDRQGVVFNMWYLAYCDEAMTAFLDAGELTYAAMLAEGTDCQVVHTDIDWHGPLGFGDVAAVDVTVSEVGRTSFTLAFALACGDRAVATVRTVYVCVATDGSGAQPVPPALRARLTGTG
jgi:acyl-CoA thioester hydrolase